MDIVEFVEKICEFPLLDFQKEYVRKIYEAIKNNEQIVYIPPRRSSKFSFELLYAIAIIAVGQERGMIKKEI